MNISIVIPVYNEAELLTACLEAISAQTVSPFEVIVVDNNSTDETVQIAQRFDFVKVLHEPRQGVVYARTRGFNAARGDIIARIDGDSIVAPNWVESIHAVFTEDAQLDAVSGKAAYYHAAAAPVFNALDLFFRRRLQRQLGDRVYLWGANMAIRRGAWQRVKSGLCVHSGLHEDYDLAIHLQEIDGVVRFDERMSVSVSARRIDATYVDFMRYVLRSPSTYAHHAIRQRWHMYELVLICALGYVPARVMRRGYDPDRNGFSLVRLFTAESRLARPDPTSNIAY